MSWSETLIRRQTTTATNFFSFEGDGASEAKKKAFLAGSYLTEPFCQSQKCLCMIPTVGPLNPTSYKVTNLARQFFLLVEALGWALIGLVTTLPGIILRVAAAGLENEPFIFYKGKADPKTLPTDREFSVLSWNVCGVGGGYPITDGGVTPREFRLERIVENIIKTDADVVCLQEVFDVVTGQFITDKLKKQGYSYFYWNIGASPSGIGCTSALFVASKYQVANPQFIPFPKETLVGRTKWAEKGLFTFDLKSNGCTFITGIATHPQQSEMPSHHTNDEELGRSSQFALIAQKAQDIAGPKFIAGDWNATINEIEKSFDLARYYKSSVVVTWGGDEWCANLMEKEISYAQDLDHIFSSNVNSMGANRPFETHFKPDVFTAEAISDHWPVKATIIV